MLECLARTDPLLRVGLEHPLEQIEAVRRCPLQVLMVKVDDGQLVFRKDRVEGLAFERTGPGESS